MPEQRSGLEKTPVTPQVSGGREGGGPVGVGLDRELLGLYLADHLAGATGGLSRAQRMAQDYTDQPFHDDLVRVAGELEEERERLQAVITRLGTSRRPLRQGLAWAGEKAGRLKLNRRLTTRSPMTPVLELKLMRGAVMAKQGLWQVLRDLPADQQAGLGLDAAELDGLIDRADEQRDRLTDLHRVVRAGAFEKA